MNGDNVTPFRRPKPKRVAPQGPPLSTHRGKAVMVQVLAFVVGFASLARVAPAFLPFSIPPIVILALSFGGAVAGFLIALSNRQSATPWAATHHEHALRTIVVSICASAFGTALVLVLPLGVVSYALWVIAGLWAMARAGMGVFLAATRRAVARPLGWLI